MWDDFFQGIGSVAGDAVQGIKDVLIAREEAKAAQASTATANVAASALAQSDVARFRIIAFAVVGLAALYFFVKSSG